MRSTWAARARAQGADAVSVRDELSRVLPVIEALASWVTVPLSIDTMKAEVAREALAAGATIVNDVGMGDPAEALGAVAADAGAAYIAMHARGVPGTMSSLARYDDLHADVARELAARVRALESACRALASWSTPASASRRRRRSRSRSSRTSPRCARSGTLCAWVLRASASSTPSRRRLLVAGARHAARRARGRHGGGGDARGARRARRCCASTTWPPCGRPRGWPTRARS